MKSTGPDQNRTSNNTLTPNYALTQKFTPRSKNEPIIAGEHRCSCLPYATVLPSPTPTTVIVSTLPNTYSASRPESPDLQQGNLPDKSSLLLQHRCLLPSTNIRGYSNIEAYYRILIRHGSLRPSPTPT